MLKINKSITVEGSSMVTVNGIEQLVMTMNANVGEDGATNVNKYIQDQDLYRANKVEAKKDYSDFEIAVDEIIDATYHKEEDTE